MKRQAANLIIRHKHGCVCTSEARSRRSEYRSLQAVSLKIINDGDLKTRIRFTRRNQHAGGHSDFRRTTRLQGHHECRCLSKRTAHGCR